MVYHPDGTKLFFHISNPLVPKAPLLCSVMAWGAMDTSGSTSAVTLGPIPMIHIHYQGHGKSDVPPI